MPLSSREKTALISKLKLQIKALKRNRDKIKATKAKIVAAKPKTTRRTRYLMEIKEVYPKVVPERKSEADICLEIQIIGIFCSENNLTVPQFGVLLATNSLKIASFPQYYLLGYTYHPVKYALNSLEKAGYVERFRKDKDLIVNTVSLKGKKLIATFNEHYLKATTPEPSPKEHVYTKRKDGRLEVTGQCDQLNRRIK